MLKGQSIPLQFPTQGVNETPAYSSPPGPSAVLPSNMQNVRAYDQLERRNRGGQRTGITKLAADPVNGTQQIQGIEPIVRALDLVQNAAWSDKLTDPAGPLGGNFGTILWASDNSFVVDAKPGAGVRVWPFDTATNSFGTGITLAEATIDAVFGDGAGGSPSTVNWIALSTDDAYLFLGNTKGLGYCTIDPVSGFGSITKEGAYVNVEKIVVDPDGTAVLFAHGTTPFLTALAWSGTAFGAALTAPTALNGLGKNVDITSDGTLVVAGTSAEMKAYSFDSATGFGAVIDTQTASMGASVGLSLHPDGIAVAVQSATATLTIYPFTVATGFGASSSTNPGISNLRSVRFSPSGSYLHVGGVNAPRTKIYNFSNTLGSVLADPGTTPTANLYDAQWSPDEAYIGLSISSNFEFWQFTAAGVNPTTREQRLVVFSGGSVYRSATDFSSFTVVSGGSAALDSTNPQILADTAFQKLFVADGIFANYQYLDFSDNTFKDWTTNLSAGSLPRGTTDTTLGCRLVAVYRGRVVLAGLKEEPQNWFMSRAGDPFDWDYSPATPDASQPVAGNNSDAGELGDIITCLAPYQDDVLIMGGANSVWVMRGDPAAGGRIDNLTRGIGVVGPEAWCFDNVGNFYFVGVNGFYKVAAGGASIELVSRGKLDKTFSDIDTTSKIIRLAYDSKWQGVGIFVCDPETPTVAETHYFYDARNNAFFPDKFPTSIGPSAVATLYDVDPENNTVILGGFDSYVRKFDETAFNDDGTMIDSFFRIPAIHPGLPMGQLQLQDMQINLDSGGGANTVLTIYQGNTPEEAELASVAAYTVTLNAGRNLPHRKRLRANALSMQLRNNTAGETWAYEAGNAIIAATGRMRATL